MYMFTKLHDSAQQYGDKTKFDAKNEELIKVVNSTAWKFCDLLQNEATI